MTDFAPIMTKRLVLKTRMMIDAPNMVELLNDKQLSYDLSHNPYPYLITDAESALQHAVSRPDAERTLNRHAWLKDNSTMIGAVMILCREKFEAPELVYWLGRNFWGQGYAKEMLDTFVPYAFDVTGKNLLSASVAQDNANSIHLLEKMGFVRKGEMEVETLYRGMRPSYHYQLEKI